MDDARAEGQKRLEARKAADALEDPVRFMYSSQKLAYTEIKKEKMRQVREVQTTNQRRLFQIHLSLTHKQMNCTLGTEIEQGQELHLHLQPAVHEPDGEHGRRREA